MKNNKILKAYPNHDDYLNISPPRDTRKWLETVREMYYYVHKGMDKGEALNRVISGWSNMEKLDFKNWIRFYEEGAHNKYKTAQVNYWEAANRAGYFVPIFPEVPKPDAASDIDSVKDSSSHPDIAADEKRQIIEKQRQKIIGRLDSAEKLLRSQEGQMFAGKELEALLDIVYSLKKKIQMVNKISLSTRLYEDMIIREANILTKKGFASAGAVLHKIAQELPAPPPPPNPTAGGGQPGSIPGQGPGMTPPPGPIPPEEDIEGISTSEGMTKFLEGLETNNDTVTDEELEVTEADDVLEVTDADDLVSTAQMAPPPPPASVEEEAPLEVTEDNLGNNSFGKKIDQVLKNVTIEDAISEFEFISNFYKAREIPRRLSRADMILDSLGLASFFPSLAEAQNKALESNNYISSRIEEILSKLQGSIKAKDVELTVSDEKAPRPDMTGIRKNLQDEEDKEKARKQMRKDLETQSLTQNKEKETPEIEVEEDLATPAQLQRQAPPVPVR